MIPSSLYCHACGAANATDRSVCFACNQPLQLVTSDNVVLLQGRYRVLTQVGKGGFGAVYRAEDTQQHNSIVAVKQINLRGLTPQETIEATDAFNREVSLLSNLSHPNLPHIYDHFTDPEHWYLVMDFIEGETLETYLETKGVNYTASLDEVLTLGIQLCTVLDYLHTREPAIIFRDLKPANIMRSSTGKLYLIDFGIARSFKPGKLRDTIPFGSPGYAAPEQYGKAQTTPRADIYSLGALLHMLLTGDDPIDNPFHFAPLRIYGAPGLSNLDALISRMVQIDANSRPATIIEVKDELQHIVDMQASPRIWHPPVGQTPPALPVISMGSGQQQISAFNTGQQQQLYVPSAQRKRNSRRKFLVGGFTIAGLTVIGAGGIANIVSALQTQSYPDSIRPPLSRYDKGRLFGRSYQYLGHTQLVQDVAWSHYDTQLASTSVDGTIQVWTEDEIMTRNTASLDSVYKTTEPAMRLAWGQGVNENKLAFTSGKTITILDITTSATRIIMPELGVKGKDVSTDIYALAWSPDGRYIVFPTSVGVQIWDSVLQSVVTHIEFIAEQHLSEGPISSLSWSFDRRHIAVGRVENKEAVVLDVFKTGQIKRLKDAGGQSVVWSPDGSMLASVNENIVNVFYNAGGAHFTMQYPFIERVTALSWSYNSKFLVAASRDFHNNSNIHVWSPFENTNDTTPSRSGMSIANDGSTFMIHIDTHGVAVHALAWSSDSRYIAIGADHALLLEVNTSELYG